MIPSDESRSDCLTDWSIICCLGHQHRRDDDEDEHMNTTVRILAMTNESDFDNERVVRVVAYAYKHKLEALIPSKD